MSGCEGKEFSSRKPLKVISSFAVACTRSFFFLKPGCEIQDILRHQTQVNKFQRQIASSIS